MPRYRTRAGVVAVRVPSPSDADVQTLAPEAFGDWHATHGVCPSAPSVDDFPIVYVGAVAWLGWLLSVRIENAQVIGPGARIWERRKRISISQVTMGPPPDWGSDYSIANDASGDRISLLYLSVPTRTRLLRVLELEHADDTEPSA